MSDVTEPGDAAAATDRDSWLHLMERIGDDAGYFEPLGPRHWAFFVDEGPHLLVTFETLEACRARSPGQMPLGHDIARRHGWSHLCVIADGDTWYRDRRVWGYFDRLVDDAFFEDFEAVTFFGAGMGGYAAGAFCVAAPGSTVLALGPRATLDPRVAGWDGRDRGARRLDFTSRYGFAPDMTDGAARVFVLHDPLEPLDAMHAALFRRPWAVMLRSPMLGTDPAAALAHLGLLEPLIEAAAQRRLDALAWARMWRARRSYGPWLRAMLARLGQGASRQREAVFCRAVASRMNAPRFRRRLADLAEQLDALGIELPPQRSGPPQG
jgi:hypothetical protein